MNFDRDPRKAERNLEKHGVSFDEAATVFGDPLAAIRDDEDHSFDETRERIIGRSAYERLLHVTFTAHEESVRIISARVATRRERIKYEER